jgi:hypothetical protein
MAAANGPVSKPGEGGWVRVQPTPLAAAYATK